MSSKLSCSDNKMRSDIDICVSGDGVVELGKYALGGENGVYYWLAYEHIESQ